MGKSLEDTLKHLTIQARKQTSGVEDMRKTLTEVREVLEAKGWKVIKEELAFYENDIDE